MAKRKHKYNAQKATADSIEFDSKHERDYYLYLKKQKQEGNLKDFELQPSFELQPKFKKKGQLIRAINYKADFKVYMNDGQIVIIDVKGFETPDFKLKKKLFEYKYDYSLNLVCKAPKYLAPLEWIELEQLKKIRKERKKQQEGKQ